MTYLKLLATLSGVNISIQENNLVTKTHRTNITSLLSPKCVPFQIPRTIGSQKLELEMLCDPLVLHHVEIVEPKIGENEMTKNYGHLHKLHRQNTST